MSEAAELIRMEISKYDQLVEETERDNADVLVEARRVQDRISSLKRARGELAQALGDLAAAEKARQVEGPDE